MYGTPERRTGGYSPSWRANPFSTARPLSGAVARLIAGHLHFGPQSALYAFAVNGSISRIRCYEISKTSSRNDDSRQASSGSMRTSAQILCSRQVAVRR